MLLKEKGNSYIIVLLMNLNKTQPHVTDTSVNDYKLVKDRILESTLFMRLISCVQLSKWQHPQRPLRVSVFK